MAEPIQFTTAELPHGDPRLTLQSRLRDAPAAHAEALLAAFEVLQGLHDSGTLDLLRGALGAKDKVLDIAVGAAGSPRSVRAARNLLLVINMLAATDPDVLRTFTRAAPVALKQMIQHPEPPGLWRLIGDFLWNRDFRHGLAAVNTMLEVFGRNWSDAKSR